MTQCETLAASIVPMFDPPNPRYKGKPLLRILELYVIWAIGELPSKEASILREITPKLRATFQKDGNWQQIIEAVMEFPAAFPKTIREYWNRNLQITRAAGTA